MKDQKASRSPLREKKGPSVKKRLGDHVRKRLGKTIDLQRWRIQNRELYPFPGRRAKTEREEE